MSMAAVEIGFPMRVFKIYCFEAQPEAKRRPLAGRHESGEICRASI